ncbi:hypothetical protein BKA61DRAFT_289391 [Leptodontidium sp. MPI-SDFR-AT-0119]|nr:hypothetical protein BKA61DRAFT_289391 [Leptodontidium sp. MPI-SDFR-AT-0119]
MADLTFGIEETITELDFPSCRPPRTHWQLTIFALAISVYRVRGKGVDQHDWDIYQNATQVAATVFPIVFAAIFGSLVTKAASWKLERGSSLGTLEQLMGSRTVFSTLVAQFNLRAFNLIGICPAILWLLSPLGGQSALRIIDTGYKQVTSVSDVVQFDTNAPSLLANWVISSLGSQGAVQSLCVPLNAMYSASLLTPSNMKLSSMDLWGNVEIPYLSSYQKSPGSA